ncbi:MAG: helix-turn-helix transcriptional regulator [Clostridia bacterium]|nr:helix-turn-helix transcriptional regulator [Clostridia bacterium]
MEFTYYKRLREVRESKHITQTEIAELLGTTRQQIGKWENGVQKMGIDKYIILARYYNVSLDYLAGLTDDIRSLS